jgi:tetratricopeptide (TPR) repeat protein
MSPSDEAFDRAIAMCEEGRFAEASDLLQRIIADQPGNVDAWVQLARAQLGDGQHGDALTSADKAADLARTSSTPRVIASLALLLLGDTDRAVARARDAVQVDPFDWRALGVLAYFLASDRRTVQEARALVDRGIQLVPDEPAAHLIRGQVFAVIGDREAARGAFRRALDLDPGSSQAHHELAQLRLRRRANAPSVLAEAAAGFERATSADASTERSRLKLELILRVFFSKVAYLLFIDAYVVGRVSSPSSGSTARLLPVLLLALPGYYAWRFLGRLTNPVRQRVRELLFRVGTIRRAALSEALSAIAIIAASIAPAGARTSLAVVGALAALVGRVVLYREAEHASRAAIGQAPRPLVRPSVMWVIAALLALTAAALLVAAAKDKAGPGAIVGALVFAAGSVAAARAASRGGRNIRA